MVIVLEREVRLDESSVFIAFESFGAIAGERKANSTQLLTNQNS